LKSDHGQEVRCRGKSLQHDSSSRQCWSFIDHPRVSGRKFVVVGELPRRRMGRTGRISSLSLCPRVVHPRLLNGLRNPMERKIDLSINPTEKIPLRSTLHHRDRYAQTLSPLSQDVRKTLPVRAQDQFLEAAPKRCGETRCAVPDGRRGLLRLTTFSTTDYSLRRKLEGRCSL